jgi:hypothetical protein
MIIRTGPCGFVAGGFTYIPGPEGAQARRRPLWPSPAIRAIVSVPPELSEAYLTANLQGIPHRSALSRMSIRYSGFWAGD